MKARTLGAVLLVALGTMLVPLAAWAEDPQPGEPTPYDETAMARLSIFTVGQVGEVKIGDQAFQGSGPHTVVLTELDKPIALTIDGSQWSVWLQAGDHKIVVTEAVEGYPRAESNTLSVLNHSAPAVADGNTDEVSTSVQIVVAECWFKLATATAVEGEWNWTQIDEELGGCRMLPNWETYDRPGAMWSIRYGVDSNGANSMDLSRQAQQSIARGQHMKSWLSSRVRNADVYVERTGSLVLRKAEAYVTVSQKTAPASPTSTASPPVQMPAPDPCVSAFDTYHPDGDWDGDGDHDREDCPLANVCPETFDEDHPDGDWDGDGDHDRDDCATYFTSLAASPTTSSAARVARRLMADLLLVGSVGTYGASVGGGVGANVSISSQWWVKGQVDLGATTDLSSESKNGEPTQLQGYQSGPLNRFYLGGGVDLLRDLLELDPFRMRWSVAGLHLHGLRLDENLSPMAYIVGARTGVDVHTKWFVGPFVGLLVEGGFMTAAVPEGESAWDEEGPGTMSSPYFMGLLQAGVRYQPEGTRWK